MYRLIICLVIATLIVPAAFAKSIPGSNRDLNNQIPGRAFGTPGTYGGEYEPFGCKAVCQHGTCHFAGLLEFPQQSGYCYCDSQGRPVCEASLLADPRRFWGVIYDDDGDLSDTAARMDALILEVGPLVASPPLAGDLEQNLTDLRDAIVTRSLEGYATAIASHEGVLEQLPTEEVVAVYDAVYFAMFTDQ